MATQQTRSLARFMMAPSVVLLFVWMIVPLVITLWFSFQQYNPLNPIRDGFVGFSNYARELRETELAGLGWDMVQGTNLHHALLLAGRHIDRHPEHEPVVLIVTDGEPTAHLQRDGRSWFDWPPSPETVELTLAEVDKMTRRHAALNIFMLADDARLSAFVDNVARRNGGRVLQAAPEHLGEYVIRDFLRTRGAGRR